MAKTKQQRYEQSRVWQLNNPEKIKFYHKQFHLKNPEKQKEYAHKWYLKNKEKSKENHIAWKLKNPDKYKTSKKNWKLKNSKKIKEYGLKKYGITLKQSKIILLQQNGKCAICLRNLNKIFCHDHNHNTGKFRGILCNNCNAGLGMFKDDIKILKKAIKYLKEKDKNGKIK